MNEPHVVLLDTQTGYYYYGARYYDPGASIFLSVDPHAEKYSEINPYVYVANNPINAIDPDGRDIRIYYTRARDTNGNAIYGAWVFNGKNAASAPKNQFVRDFLDAYNYNVNNGGGDNIKSAAFDRSEIYDLTEQTEAMGGSSFYPTNDGRTAVIWDPLTGLQTENGDVLSPATILEHEFDHANAYVNDTEERFKRKDQGVAGYSNAEEKRAIIGSETKTARANGEISPNKSQSRFSHKGTFVPVESPSSNKVRNTKNRSSGSSNQISKGLYNYERN